MDAEVKSCTDLKDKRNLIFLYEKACTNLDLTDVVRESVAGGVRENDASSFNQSNRNKRRKRFARNDTTDEDDEKGFCEDCSVPSYLETEYQFLKVYMTIDEEERFAIGHQFEDMVKECTFRGRDCTQEKYDCAVD